MKRILVVILSIILVFSVSVIACADNERVSGAFTYRVKGNGTAVITGYDWESQVHQDIFIPRMIDGYTVTEIDSCAFASVDENWDGQKKPDVVWPYGAASLVIPDTVVSIGDKAFMGICFEDTTSISIPASVQHIGAGAFSCTYNIQQFVVDAGNTTYATIDGVLFNKKEKSLIAYPNGRVNLEYSYKAQKPTITYEIPNGIVSIGDFAFYDVTIGKFGDYKLGLHLVFPDTVESIGEWAFAHAAVSYYWDGFILKLPANLKSLGTGAFYCALAGNNDKFCYGDYDGVEITSPYLKEIPAYAFYGISNMNSELILPENLQSIGEKAFYSYEGDAPNFPVSLVEIGESAFEEASFNSALTFGNDSELKSIGDKAFYNVTKGINKLVLPQKLEEIGESAFADSSLSELTIPPSVDSIGDAPVNRGSVYLNVESGSYAALWASENGYVTQQAGSEDTSWLTNP